MPGTGHLFSQLLYSWRETEQREQRKESDSAFHQRLRQENAQLRKALVKKTLEVDFLKAACEKVEALRQASYRHWRNGIWEAIREMMPTQSSLGVEPMCRLAAVSRAGFYRFLEPRYPGEEQMEVRHAIHGDRIEHRGRYGYRRVTVELGRRGMRVTISACCG